MMLMFVEHEIHELKLKGDGQINTSIISWERYLWKELQIDYIIQFLWPTIPNLIAVTWYINFVSLPKSTFLYLKVDCDWIKDHIINHYLNYISYLMWWITILCKFWLKIIQIGIQFKINAPIPKIWIVKIFRTIRDLIQY